MSVLVDMFAGEITDLSNPALWLTEWAQGPRTAAGQTVTSTKADRLSAYWACLRALSEDVAKLPLAVFARTGEHGKTRVPDHPAHRILHHQPNPDMTPFPFVEQIISHAAGWGNGYAEIQRDRMGRPLAMYPIHPGRVQVRKDEQGRVFYRVRVGDAGVMCDGTTAGMMGQPLQYVDLPSRDILHVHGPADDGICGKSVLRAAADALGIGLAAQDFGGAFFANGTSIGGVLMHPGELSPQAQKSLRDSWVKMYSGAGKAKRPAILEEGMKWEPTSVPPNEAQFLETRQFQVIEICRFFRMPPHKVQELGRATWGNIESQNIEYVGDTLMPWLCRMQEECEAKLFTDDERAAGLMIRFITQALLRGDSTARTAYYRQMQAMGAMNADEIRRYEDMNPRGDELADRYYIASNLTPVDQPEPEPAMPGDDMPDDDGDDDAADAYDNMRSRMRERAEELRPVIHAAAEQVLRKEHRAVDRAADKHLPGDIAAMSEWADGFYRTHRAYMMTAFRPVVGVIAATGFSPLNDYCTDYCARQADPARMHKHSPDELTAAVIAAVLEAYK